MYLRIILDRANKNHDTLRAAGKWGSDTNEDPYEIIRYLLKLLDIPRSSSDRVKKLTKEQILLVKLSCPLPLEILN